MMRKQLLVVALLAICLLELDGWIVTGQGTEGRTSAAMAAQADQDLLAALREGCANAVSSIGSGAGKVTVYLWLRRADGGVLETEADDEVRFSGDQFRLSERVKYLANDPVPDQELPQLIGSGTVRNKVVSYDLEKVTVLDQDQGHATICDPTRGEGRNLLLAYRQFPAVLGHGVAHLIQEDLPSSVEVTSIGIAGQETVNGDECMLVDVVLTAHPTEKDTVVQTVRKWVNVDKGYTIVKTRKWAEGSGYSQKTLTTEVDVSVRQYGEGVWGPDTITWQQYGTGPTGKKEVMKKAVITYDPAFKLNVPVGDSDLSMTLPSGTKVHDELLMADYTVP